MQTTISRVLAIIIMTLSQVALAQGNLDGQSVESIRQALQSPIPSEVHRTSQTFDDQLLRTGTMQGQRVQLTHDERSTRATQIVERLLKGIRVDPSKWVIRVLDTNPRVENAFVVGGTHIYVYTGLIDNVKSDDELAFVLAHEVSHSLLKHNLRRDGDITNLAASLVELSAAMSKSENRKEKFGTIGGAIKAAYSRGDEQEADALAVVIATRGGFDVLRGIEFFSRNLRAGEASAGQSQEEYERARQTVETQIANCNSLRSQWETNPRIRTPANAQVVNSACQTAQTNSQRLNSYSQQQARAELKSQLLSSHPADQERIGNLVAANDHVKGRRSLDSLSGIGQGYKVFLALRSMQKP